MKKIVLNLTALVCSILLIVSCGNKNNNKENVNDSTASPTLEIQTQNASQLASDFLGNYQGIQPSYFVKNQYGNDMVINGSKVPVPSSDFKFLLKQNNMVSLQQTNSEDNRRVYYNGTFKILNDNTEIINIECSLSDGKSSNPTYRLSIKKSDKSGTCSCKNEPDFTVKKISNNENKKLGHAYEDSAHAYVDSASPGIRVNKEEEVSNQNIYETGYYITNGSTNKYVYFYNAPNKATKRSAHFDSQDNVYVQKIENGFGFIEFTNTQGQKSIGWLSMKDLIAKPL